MKKVITFLFLINIIVSVAWFNYQVYQKVRSQKQIEATIEIASEKTPWLSIKALDVFQNNFVSDILFKRF